MENFESIYDKVLEKVFMLANPIKKSVIKTQCLVHKFINYRAIRILKNDMYWHEYYFFSKYLKDMDQGAVWADQDFKSSNHFYDPHQKRGLFGRRSAMDLGLDYYSKALKLWKDGKYNKSMFYLGAYLHIVQDMTIPQHASIRLLGNHRQYETYIKKTYNYMREFHVDRGAYILDNAKDYIRFNARVTLMVYKEFQSIKDEKERFYRLARCGLPLAKRTSAGSMILFYRTIKSWEN